MNKKEIKEMNKEIEKLIKIGKQKNKPHWDNVCEVKFYWCNNHHEYGAILPIDEDNSIEDALSYSISLEYKEPDAEFQQKFYYIKVKLRMGW